MGVGVGVGVGFGDGLAAGDEARCILRFIIRVIVHMLFRQHALMKNAGDQNPPFLLPIKNDMPAALHTMQARTDIITGTAQSWSVCQLPATGFEIVKIAIGLGLSPVLNGKAGNIQ